MGIIGMREIWKDHEILFTSWKHFFNCMNMPPTMQTIGTNVMKTATSRIYQKTGLKLMRYATEHVKKDACIQQLQSSPTNQDDSSPSTFYTFGWKLYWHGTTVISYTDLIVSCSQTWQKRRRVSLKSVAMTISAATVECLDHPVLTKGMLKSGRKN